VASNPEYHTHRAGSHRQKGHQADDQLTPSHVVQRKPIPDASVSMLNLDLAALQVERHEETTESKKQQKQPKASGFPSVERRRDPEGGRLVMVSQRAKLALTTFPRKSTVKSTRNNIRGRPAAIATCLIRSVQ
jgi:hypothetical protein